MREREKEKAGHKCQGCAKKREEKKVTLHMISIHIRNSEKTGCFQDSHFRKLYAYCKDGQGSLFI